MELWQGNTLYATLMGIISGMMFGCVIVMMRQLRERDSAWILCLNHAATVAILLPMCWGQPWNAVSPPAYLALALFGLFQLSLPYLLFIRGLRSVPGPEASLLTLLEPVLLPFWVFLAWRHHPSYQAPQWWTWTGAALILTGLVLRYLPGLMQTLAGRSADNSVEPTASIETPS
jgi:drug/metabolite transporter (DMT)-like permease